MSVFRKSAALILGLLSLVFAGTLGNAIEPPGAAPLLAQAPGAALAAPADAAEAADPAAIARGLEAFKDGGCRACHGWAGNGEREGPAPLAPSLRATLLPADAVRLTVQCGRPGTEMPYHDRQAYGADGRCYGFTRETVGTLRPPRGNVLDAAEMDDLVTYLLAEVVGKAATPTRAECEAYFGPGNSRCTLY